MGLSADWLDRPLARRDVLSGIARAALGVSVGCSLGGRFPGSSLAAEELASGKKRAAAKNIIMCRQASGKLHRKLPLECRKVLIASLRLRAIAY